MHKNTKAATTERIVIHQVELFSKPAARHIYGATMGPTKIQRPEPIARLSMNFDGACRFVPIQA